MTTAVVCIQTDAGSATRLEIKNSEIENQVTITPEDVDTRWPFRAGYPRLLRPSVINLPIIGPGKPISDANFEDLKSQIDSILETYNIPRGARPHKLVHRRQLYGKLGHPRVVVDCTYDKESSHSKLWAKAVIKVYTAIQSVVEGNTEVGVEMFDWQYMLSTHICTCPPDESKELLANWEIGHNYLRKILQLFDDPREMFQAMTPVGRCSAGEREYEWSLVIFFDAMNAEDDEWISIEDSIRSILPDHIGIEIQQRAGPLFCNSDDGNTEQSVEFDQPSWVSTTSQKYKEDPQPGCEVSPQDKYWRGTMGGYVKTVNKATGKRTTYGITNAHVVCNGEWYIMSRAPAESGIKMQSPSAGTQVADVDRLQARIKLLEKELQTLKSIKKKRRGHNAPIAQHTRRAIEIKEKELTWYYTHLQDTEKIMCIGVAQNAIHGAKEYLNSEPRHGSDFQLMDLALITMDCDEPWERPLMESADEPKIPKGTPYHSWEGDHLGNPNDAEQHIKVVAKLGKGFYRMGVVSEFHGYMAVRPEHGPLKTVYTQPILRPPRFQKGEGTEVEVDDLARQELETPPQAFFERGDSGAFVIASTEFTYGDYSNRVAMPSTQGFSSYANVAAPMPFAVGVGWGHSDNVGISYMMPFGAVKQEIENLTGETMVWPQKRTEYLKELEQFRFEDIMNKS